MRNNNVNSSLGIGMDVTPIYGGHLTLAIGDPFLVSSFSAKTLWYMVSAPTISLSASTLDANNPSKLINLSSGFLSLASYSPVAEPNSSLNASVSTAESQLDLSVTQFHKVSAKILF